jgi:hypothetical protein
MRRTDHKAPHYVIFSTPSYPALLGPNVFLSTLFLNTLSLRSSLNATDQVSHPYETEKMTVLYALIFVFLDSKLEDWKALYRMIASIPRVQSALNFFLNATLIC